MTWLFWRQYRANTIFTAIPLAVFILVLLITGINMAADYDSALSTCAASGTCGNLQLFTSNAEQTLIALVGVLSLVVPFLLGVFWGAPLIATELEAGTHQFIWVQGVTRRRWLAAKLGWILLSAAVCGGTAAVAVTWWSGPTNAINHDRFASQLQFNIQGIVPIAHAIFAVALGVAAGTLIRRTMPAFAATLAIFGALLFALQQFVRPHYLPAVTKTVPLTEAEAPSEAWTLAADIVDPSGQIIGTSQGGGIRLTTEALPAACRAISGPDSFGQFKACLDANGYHTVLTYHPADRYWPFQGIESGIFLILAAILVVLTIRAINRRDA